MSDWDCHMDRWEERFDRKMARMQEKMQRVRDRMERYGDRGGWGFGPTSSGNRAFDDYRSETLKRLEDEQREFKEFLERLRFAKDRAEFDQFMDQRRQRPSEEGPAPGRRKSRRTTERRHAARLQARRPRAARSRRAARLFRQGVVKSRNDMRYDIASTRASWRRSAHDSASSRGGLSRPDASARLRQRREQRDDLFVDVALERHDELRQARRGAPSARRRIRACDAPPPGRWMSISASSPSKRSRNHFWRLAAIAAAPAVAGFVGQIVAQPIRRLGDQRRRPDVGLLVELAQRRRRRAPRLRRCRPAASAIRGRRSRSPRGCGRGGR